MWCLVVCVFLFGGFSAVGSLGAPWSVGSAMSACSSFASTPSSFTCMLQAQVCDSTVGSLFSKDPPKVYAKCSTKVVNAALLNMYGLEVKGPGLATLLGMDNSTMTVMDQCFLNSSKLLSNDMTLNRTTVLLKVMKSKYLAGSSLLPNVTKAVTACPEPLDFKIAPFLQCLTDACMSNFLTSSTDQTTSAKPPISNS